MQRKAAMKKMEKVETSLNIPGTLRILLHCPDITLKGKNQGDFQYALCRNIKRRLDHIGFKGHVGPSRGRV